MTPPNNSEALLKGRRHEAEKITWIGFFINMILSVGKIMAGIFGKSAAMLADGVHSFSDFVTDLVVIAFIKVSSKAKDDDHRYGHGKYETFATLIISIALIVVGAGILSNGIHKIIDSFNGIQLEKPTYLALIAAAVSIISKEILFRCTNKVGKKIKSDAVVANAWHHRSDAFSSIGTLLGISGAMFLSQQWRILDPIASIIVSIFIFIAALKIIIPAINELLDHALPKEIEDQMSEAILAVDGVKAMHHLDTRKNGNSYVIDVHIKVDKDLSVLIGHNIASNVEEALRDRYPDNQVMTSVHIEPYFGKNDAIEKDQ